MSDNMKKAVEHLEAAEQNLEDIISRVKQRDLIINKTSKSEAILSFNDNGKDLGKIYIEDNKLAFSGDMQESAKVFLKWVCDMYNSKEVTDA